MQGVCHQAGKTRKEKREKSEEREEEDPVEESAGGRESVLQKLLRRRTQLRGEGMAYSEDVLHHTCAGGGDMQHTLRL